jgi:acyl transferase domain-containing protein/phosphopantetheinyl transferase
MSKEKDVALVGMSCVFPKAKNLKQYWSNLVNAVDAVGSPPPGRWSDCSGFRRCADHEAFLAGNRGGFLDSGLAIDVVAYGIPPHLVRHGDPDQFFTLHLIDHALRDARIADDSPLRKRTDVLIGQGGYPTDKHMEWALRSEHFESVLNLLERRCPEWVGPRREELESYLRSTLTAPEIDNVSSGISNLTASRAANRLNLRGAAFVVDAACASSLLAVEQAIWRLRTGQCDLAVAAGVFVSLSLRVLYVFTRLGALSPSGMIRPFDRRADGLLPGEGGGAVVLKRLADAIRDGDEIYAVIKGVGSASDGKEVDVLAPSSTGQIAALETAYADAGIDRGTIGYLELHGTGTVAGDSAEIATLKGFFGAVSEPATARAMGSVKSMIGHTLPAAGMASLIKAALSLSNKVLCPSLHCEEPRPELAEVPFYLNTQTRPWIHNPALGPRRAGVNAFGFGGINAHVILEEVAIPKSRGHANSPGRSLEPIEPVPLCRPFDPGLDRPSELVVFSAASESELAAKIDRLERFLDADGSGATLADIAWSLTREFKANQPVKLALVCEDLTQLRRLLRDGRLKDPSSANASGNEAIYYADDASTYRGKIALVFPGMGFPGLIGGYPDRLMELCLHYPEVRAEFDHFEDRDRHPEDTVPTSAIFMPPACLPEDYRQQLKGRLHPPRADEYGTGEPLPRERYLAAMGVTLSNWVSWLLLRKFNIPVDMLAGQSQGEMAALCAAGAADFHQLAPAFWKVLNIDSRDANGGQIAFAWTAAEELEPLLAEEPDTHIAIHMAPEGVIFGGDRGGVRRIAERLRECQIYVQTLPYPPIHTPRLSHLRVELRRLLAAEQALIRKPQVAFYSSITASLYPDDEGQIFDTLLMNVDCPLRIWQTALRMYQDGARIFVQVGGGHMAAHRMMLPEEYRVTTAALDVDGRNPLTQLNHLLATLLCNGLPLELAPLYEYRRVRTLDFAAPAPPPSPSHTAVPLRLAWSPAPDENAVSCRPTHQGADDPERAEADDRSPKNEAAALEAWVAEAALPVLGRITHFVPQKELTLQRTLDLKRDLFLHDHVFVNAPHKPSEQRVPVLPLTMSMEFAAEAAALLSPGLGLVGFENIRGRRWIALHDASTLELRIEARVVSLDPQTGVQRVQVTLLDDDTTSFSATVLFAETYRQDLDNLIAEPSGGQAWPLAAEQVYAERYMFHGPAFQCIAELSALGEQGASAVLAVRPRDQLFASCAQPLLFTDPCVMDGVGQIVGLWARLNGRYILPLGVEKIEFFGPPPAPESLLPIRIEIVELSEETQQIRANVELEDGQGGVWARLTGWTEYLWKWSDRYVDCTELPHHHIWADELTLPGAAEGSVCTAIASSELAGVNLEWTAHLFLHEAEMPEFLALADKRRRQQFLASRVAAKDAIRLWWSRRHDTLDLPHPSLFLIAHDDLGQPYFVLDEGPTIGHLSLAHTEVGAVALVAEEPVGIDVESATRDASALLPDFATAEEAELLAPLAAVDASAATRLWCAKEAMAKARGTGLRGRPKEFTAQQIEANETFLLGHRSDGDQWLVHTAQVGPFVLAYTSAQDRTPDGAVEEPRPEDQTEGSEFHSWPARAG